ncbi:acyl carrier protein [Streptomyces roseochromogenus]|uniref:Phosphopantetheine-binding protein n=1 Tax=Streptomyces roseochromogenus subsp. oscitans DS 12.976 TaxID=1352936 RepID=V6KWR1_STRRC|nr:acyl carrier protein [Streptomyces roseochromogenus]EST36463.1 phosphopantetheine-binding protein [Streptomyces roseochromogenus subsp. oscitans DS 12.976]
MKPLDHAEAMSVIKESITQIVPDADFAQVEPDDKFRDVLELDSLDFLSLVQLLSERTGIRIDEEDYPELTTLSGATRFLVDRSKESPGAAP